MMLDLEVLRLIWWVLMGVLFMGFAIMDGFDLGVATLLPFVAKNDIERRIVLNTIGPVWEGNQVWIIVGAGAVFAAWPYVYAVAFSGAYFAVLLLLLTMGISRPVSFKYRSKLPSDTWRRFWDRMVFIGGFVPSLVFGVLVGNILLGLPFAFDDSLRMTYSGSLFALFSPFALLCGLTSVAMLIMHGGLYLAIKTESVIRERALRWSRRGALAMIILFAVCGYFIAYSVSGYVVTSEIDPLGYSNPLHKTVVSTVGAWMNNYATYPITRVLPVLGFAGAIFAYLFSFRGVGRFAFVCSSFAIIGVIGTVGVSMFPFILPSSTNLASGLLVFDASSTYLTLLIMLSVTAIFLPLILLYTAWVYRVLRGKVTRETIENDVEKAAY